MRKIYKKRGDDVLNRCSCWIIYLFIVFYSWKICALNLKKYEIIKKDIKVLNSDRCYIFLQPFHYFYSWLQNLISFPFALYSHTSTFKDHTSFAVDFLQSSPLILAMPTTFWPTPAFLNSRIVIFSRPINSSYVRYCFLFTAIWATEATILIFYSIIQALFATYWLYLLLEFSASHFTDYFYLIFFLLFLGVMVDALAFSF